MAQDGLPNFEIPPEMRKFAEQSVEQARRAFEGFIAAAHSTVSGMEGRVSKAQAGAQDVGATAMSFAQHNVAASFEFARKLVQAKDMNEIMRLQADYLKAQIQALNQQAAELGKVATKAMEK